MLATLLGATAAAGPPGAGPPRATVRSTPIGAALSVNGVPTCVTPCELADLVPGASVDLVFLLDGYLPRTSTLLVPEAGDTVFSVVLDLAGPVADLGVKLQGAGWAYVYLDGVKLKQIAPFGRLPVRAGTHVLRAENPQQGLWWEQTVELPAGQATTIVVARPPPE